MENMAETHKHDQKVIQFFEQQQPILENIYEKGFSDFVESLNNLPEAFKEHDSCIRCMDEGTPGGFHSAGSGILREEEEVLEAFKKAGVKKITSHDGCGAAGLYAKANNLDLTKSDEYGKEFAKKIAEKLNVPYEHINFSEMKRPETNHIARVAYYDGTGKFDYSKVEELPAGFIISRGIQQLSDSIAEANVAFNIATGHHGFGNLVSEKNPFVVCAIGKNLDELNQFKTELSVLKKEFGENIKIDGFVFPQDL